MLKVRFNYKNNYWPGQQTNNTKHGQWSTERHRIAAPYSIYMNRAFWKTCGHVRANPFLWDIVSGSSAVVLKWTPSVFCDRTDVEMWTINGKHFPPFRYFHKSHFHPPHRQTNLAEKHSNGDDDTQYAVCLMDLQWKKFPNIFMIKHCHGTNILFGKEGKT